MNEWLDRSEFSNDSAVTPKRNYPSLFAQGLVF